MNLEEVERQRKIGKQLMMLKIIRFIEDRERRIGVSFINLDNLVAWTEMSEDEVRDFVNQYNCLENFTLASYASEEYTGRKSNNLYLFFTAYFYRFGHIYCVRRIKNSKNPYSLIADQKIAESIISKYGLDVPKEYFESVELRKALDFFYQYYIEKIQEAIESGYDKVVVDKMLAELNSPL